MTDGRDDASDAPSPVDRVIAEFLDALHRGRVPDRRALLEANPDLADELGAFFAAHDRIDLLAAPIRAVARESADLDGPTDPVDGELIGYFGDYELIGELARGGMGVVYRARQVSLNRPVAVKMILAGSLATADDLRRFRTEAEAAANLDHPNIVPIYEVGEHDGRRYFSMKLIEGSSLADRLPEYGADPRAAARLVATVAAAVDHAHRRGVLHRDLKPSNILVDAWGAPHVTDFGLARRVEAVGELTQTGAILGTPSYMAPEQATGRRGEVTTATDVYGLGAVLYTLLAGRPPFRADSALATIEQVRDRAPDPPSGLNGRVDRDLETICLKCLEKEPGRRYASAEALAEDLGRWLRGEPIAARPVGRAGRAWRWCRRNPVVAGLAGALAAAAVALVAGLAVGNVLLKRERDEAREQRQLARDQTRAAEREKERADRRAAQARWTVDRMLTGVAEKWLSQQSKMEPMQLAFLEDAARLYGEFAGDEARDPGARRNRGQAEMRIGDILQRLGRREESEAAYRRAIEQQEALYRDYPDEPRFAHDLAASGNNFSILLSISGKNAAAEPMLRKAIAAWESLRGRAIQNAPRPESALVNGYGNLAALLIELGRGGEAEPVLDKAVALCEAVLADQPGDRLAQRGLVVALQNKALLVGGIPGRRREAEECTRRSLEVLAKLTVETPGDAELRDLAAKSHHRLGHLAYDDGRFAESEAAHDQFLTLATALAADFPESPGSRAVLAEARNCWAWYLVTVPDPSRRDPARAVALAREAVDGSPQDGNAWGTLGTALYYDGQWQAAVEAQETSMKLLDGGAAHNWFLLAMAHARLGHPEPARSWHDRATRWVEEHHSQDETLKRFAAESAELVNDEDAARRRDLHFPADPFAR